MSEPILLSDLPTPQAGTPAGGGVSSVLYRAALGPLNVEHYLRVFERFDTTGQRQPVWHGPAALCTLGWLVLRRLWGPALVYTLLLAGLLGLVLLVWPWLAAWPAGVRYGVLGVLLLLWCLWPGWVAHALLHRQVQRRILQAVGAAGTLAEAQTRLRRGGVGPGRLRLVVSGSGLLLSGLLFLGAWQPWQSAVPPPAVVAKVVPPATVQVPVEARVVVPAPVPVAAPPDPVPPSRPAPQADRPPVTAASPVPVAPVVTVTAADPRPSVKPVASPASATGFGVNVGLFAVADNAQRAHQRLLQAQLPATVEVLPGPQGERFRVRVGPYGDAAAVDAAAVQVRLLGLDAVVFPTR